MATASAVVITTALVVARPWNRGVPEAHAPQVTFTQDSAGVHVHIHNTNKHWGLRDQPVRVMLRTSDGFPIRLYGPDEDTPVALGSKQQFHCCRITFLPPGGDFTLELLATTKSVGGVELDLRGGRLWIRM